jgi:hypothetical protein
MWKRAYEAAVRCLIDITPQKLPGGVTFPILPSSHPTAPFAHVLVMINFASDKHFGLGDRIEGAGNEYNSSRQSEVSITVIPTTSGSSFHGQGVVKTQVAGVNLIRNILSWQIINYIEITRLSLPNVCCLHNLVFIKTSSGRPGHLQVIHNICKILARILAT